MRRHPTTLLLLLTSILAAPVLAHQDHDRFAKKLDRARAVYEEMLDMPDRDVTYDLEEDAECIAIIPSVIKGAFGWGGRHGRGVISCRGQYGEWSPPAFVELSGGSFGLQIGGEATDYVLFFMTEHSIDSLLRSKFILGGDVSVAAGGVGRAAGGATDARLNAEIIAYAKSRGLFAGASIEGARLAADRNWIERYYGPGVEARDVLFGPAPPLQPEAEALIATLP
jgi:lipid-binding SYLF domain-containing protein